MFDDETRDVVNNIVKTQSKLFTFLVDPDSYLLAASIVSGVFAAPFIVLNIIALECVLSRCDELQNGSNTLTGWILFESITLAFIAISAVAGFTYWRACQKRQIDK